jgi:imidazoleglycerol phosphate synthase glutamine amidotransferase subunit HisH
VVKAAMVEAAMVEAAVVEAAMVEAAVVTAAVVEAAVVTAAVVEAAVVAAAATVLRLPGTGRHEDCCSGKEQQAAVYEVWSQAFIQASYGFFR